MRTVPLRNTLTGNVIRVPSARVPDYFGTSNTCSDGTPLYQVVPEYHPQNPKIDMYGQDGRYLASTNFFLTCRDALRHFQRVGLSAGFPVRADRSK